MGIWQEGTITGGPDTIVPAAGFALDKASGQIPLTVKFYGYVSGPGTVTSYAWDFGDGSTSTEQNPSHTYTSAGTYTVNLTATGPAGSNSAVKTGLITVTGSGADLTVSAGPTSTSSPAPNLFAHYTANPISATVKNQGTQDAGSFNVSFNVDGNITRVNVASLAAGASTVVSTSDPVDRSIGASVPVTVTADAEGAIAESNEANNAYSYTASVIRNGYAGMRWGDGPDIVTNKTTTLHGDIIYSLGNSYYGSGSVTWTASDLPIPAGATVKDARLYIPYTWDSGNVMPGAAVTSFNGMSKNYDAFYSDKKNWGGYSNPFGVIIYNVTDQFNKDGNSVSASGIPPIRGMELVVTYEDPAATEKQIFVNEGFDLLYAASKYYTTEETATAYAPFTGATIDLSNVKSATLTTFINKGGSGDTRGTMLFNGHEWPNYWYLSGAPEIAVNSTDVTTCLAPTGNTAGFRSLAANDMDMEPHLAILKVEHKGATVTAPVASFSSTTASGTAPFTAIFTDTSTNTPTSWLWDFGDNDATNATVQNPVHTYTKAGTFTVNLTAANAGGSNSTVKSGCITVNPAIATPVASFTSTTASGTAPFTVAFTDASTNSPTTWLWDFGDNDATNATVQNPVHTYAKAGTYTVNLTATNSAGSSFSKQAGYVTVSGSITPPVANFNIVLSDGKMPHGPAPVTVSFTDASTGTVSSYVWEYRNFNDTAWTAFGAGAANPTGIIFANPGTYDIRLTVTNSGGSSNKTIAHAFTAGTLHDYLTTVSTGTVSGDLYVSSQSPWPAKTVTYSYTLPASGSNVTWARIFVNDYSGSGSNNYPVRMTTEFDANGDGSWTTLGSENCDIQSETNSESSDGQPYAYPLNDHVTKVYSDYEAWYDVTSRISSKTPKIRVTSSDIGVPVGTDGGYDGRLKAVTLVVAYNDGDSDQVKYIVNHGNDWVIAGSSSTAFDTSSFGTGWANATLTEVAHSGTDAAYTLNGASLTGTSLGSNSYYKYNTFNVTNSLTPSASNTFGYTAGSSSFKICLAALAVRYPGAAAPVASFTSSTTAGTAPYTVIFTDTSTNSPTSWLWDFGDKNSTNATVQNPVHTYAKAGTYTVNLTATNTAGSSSSEKTGYVTVNAATATPVASFTATPVLGLAPLPVQFNDTSSNTPATWVWEYRPSGTSGSWTQFSTARNATNSFAAGAYDVRLTSTNSAGSSTATQLQYISSSAGPARLSTVRNGTVSGDLYVGAFQPVAWSSQPSTPGVKEFTQVYTLPAHTDIQWARLYAVVYAAGTDSRAGQAVVSFDGNGDGTYETVLGTETLATAATSAADVYPINDHVNRQYSDYKLAYDVTSLISGNTANAKIVTQNTTSTTFDGRLKELTLVVAYNDGDSDQVKYWVNEGHDYQTSTGSAVTTLFGTGSLASGWQTATLKNVALATTDASYTFNGNALTGQSGTSLPSFETNSWDVKNSITAGSDSSFTYTHATVSGTGKSYKTTLATIAVKYTATVAPVASFSSSARSGTAPYTVIFTDTSTNSPTSWLWDFGDKDSTNATVQNPVHTYANAGTYTVNLTAANDGGSNSSVKTGYVTVSAAVTAPVAAFGSDVTSGTAPLTVTFKDISENAPTAWLWDFGDNSTVNATVQNPVHTYYKAGTYAVNLTVANSAGTNSNKLTGFITVTAPVIAPVASFSSTAASGTAPFTVVFTDTSTNSPTSWLWNFGDGDSTNATVQNPVHTYASAGTYTVNLTATNSAGSSSYEKAGYVTVSSATVSSPDLVITGMTFNTGGSYNFLFANETNTVSVTVKNNGTAEAGASVVSVDISGVRYTANVGALTVGSNQTVTVTDSTIRMGNAAVTVTATADSAGTVAESDETNNAKVSAQTVHNHGYKGKRYTGGSDVTTKQVITGRNTLVYSAGNSAYAASGWNGKTTSWTASDLPVPAGSEIVTARLYQPYTYDQTPGGSPAITATFNGNAVTADVVYKDRKGFGTYDYPYGLFVYNVTGTFGAGSSNTLVLTNGTTNNNSLYGGYLVVVYRNTSDSQKTIWLNEEADLLIGKTTYAVTGEEATAYAPFAGIDTTGMTGAKIIAIATGAGKGGAGNSKFLFNGQDLGTFVPGYLGTPQISMMATDVTGTIQAGANTAGFQSTGSSADTIIAGTAILVVESSPSATTPVASFTSSAVSGTAPYTVIFTDTSTNSPTSWLWDFGDKDSTNATVQNPVHTYAKAGTYTVNLTATNTAGSSSSEKAGYVTVNAATVAPVAAFGADVTSGTAPLTVVFRDISENAPTAWLWDFGDNSAENATVQNPVHTYTTAGTYAVNLTVVNSAGTNSNKLTGFITVNAPGTPVPTVTPTPTPTTTVPATVAPVAAFTANKTEGDKPLAVKFADKSTNSPTAWIWNFGDSGTSAEQNPVHTFTDAGTYTVNLTAINAAGNTTKSSAITVISPVVRNNTFAVSNVTATTTPGGAQNVSIDLTGGNVTKSGNTVTIVNTSSWSKMEIVLAANTTESSGSAVNGTVDGVKAVTEPVSAPITSVGTPTVQIALNMSAMPGTTAAITQTITKDPDAAAQSSFTLAASGNGKQIDEVAYTLNVQKTNVANAGDGGIIQSATLTMTVSKIWVDAHGGTGSLVVFRRADDGTTQILTPAVSGPDGSGIYTLTIISPKGLSTFSLASVSAVSSGSPGSSSGSYYNNGDTDTVTSVSSVQSSTARKAPADPSANPWTTQTINGPTGIAKIELQPVTTFGKDFFLQTSKPDSLPASIPKPDVPVYELHKIDLYHATSSDVNQAKITFSVPQAYLDSQKMTYRDVQLYRFHNNAWEKLPTTYLGVKDGSHQYQAATPGFSYFATVLSKDATLVNVAETTPTTAAVVGVQPTTVPATLQVKSTAVPAPAKTQEAPPAPAPQEPALPLPMIIGIVAVIAVIAVAIVTVRRWHVRKQNPALFREYK